MIQSHENIHFIWFVYFVLSLLRSLRVRILYPISAKCAFCEPIVKYSIVTVNVPLCAWVYVCVCAVVILYSKREPVGFLPSAYLVLFNLFGFFLRLAVVARSQFPDRYFKRNTNDGNLCKIDKKRAQENFLLAFFAHFFSLIVAQMRFLLMFVCFVARQDDILIEWKKWKLTFGSQFPF